MPQPSEPVLLRLAVRAFVWPSHPALEVDVMAKGTHLTTWAFHHPGDTGFVERSVVIPPDARVDGVVHLELAIPRCRSPRELGMSHDERRLGLGLARGYCALAGAPEIKSGWLVRGRSAPQAW